MRIEPEVTVETESKMKSDAGSSMSRINSLTDTTGFRSPQSAACGAAMAGFVCADEAGGGCCAEQAAVSAKSPMATESRK